MFCPKCGNELPENAKFCVKCGTPVPSAPTKQTQQPAVREESVPVSEPIPAQPESAPMPESLSAQPVPQTFTFNALKESGETVCGTLGSELSGAAQEMIPGPFKVIGSAVKQFFSAIGSALKEPKKLIPVLVLAVIWLALNILKACGVEWKPLDVLSFLTFANGGMSGKALGAVGGVIGKGLFAGAAASLVSGIANRKKGEKRSLIETLKGAFGFSKDTLWAYLAGAGAAMLLYLFISGGATKISFMGGLAAAFLAAKSALNDGFVRKLTASLTSKGKASAGPGAAGFVRGLAAGFLAAAAVGLSGINLILIILGGLLLAGGIVMAVLTKTGVVKLGKEVQAQ